MSKTLEEAIGCWTVNPKYNALPHLAKMVAEAARWCRTSTNRGNTQALGRDLRILRERLESMMEVTKSAEARLVEIIEGEEVSMGRYLGWVVKLTKVPAANDFKPGFFPRTLRYKRDAEALAREVLAKGGDALVTRPEREESKRRWCDDGRATD